jgi:hypothetical protein
MAYLIGTDEAGYGPNLGPLLISASVWQVPDAVQSDQLYRHLEHVVAATLPRAAGAGRPRIAIADSKLLYQSGKGIGGLEMGVLAALGLLGRRPRSWIETWPALGADAADRRKNIPWYADFDTPVPLDVDPDQLDAAVAALADGLQRAGVRLVELRSRAIFEPDFNQALDDLGSKGEALSRATLDLVAQVAAGLEDGPIQVVCDKHGGRNCYARLLAEPFPDSFIEVRGEGRQRSTYRFGPEERRVEIRFEAKAESHLPTALASMASKYLRELAMRAFNDFWCRRVPGLVETAGYPGDARRFKADIATAQAGLGIDDRMVWRSR